MVEYRHVTCEVCRNSWAVLSLERRPCLSFRLSDVKRQWISNRWTSNVSSLRVNHESTSSPAVGGFASRAGNVLHCPFALSFCTVLFPLFTGVCKKLTWRLFAGCSHIYVRVHSRSHSHFQCRRSHVRRRHSTLFLWLRNSRGHLRDKGIVLMSVRNSISFRRCIILFFSFIASVRFVRQLTPINCQLIANNNKSKKIYRCMV